MKKVLLSSVAALAVFAAAAPAFAADDIPFGGPNDVLAPGYVDTDKPASLEEAKAFGDHAQQENSC